MAKRNKRAQKGIESLKKVIEDHFRKIEMDIKEKNLERGRYHYKEIENSLIVALGGKLKILKQDESLVESYKQRLKKLKEKLEL